MSQDSSNDHIHYPKRTGAKATIFALGLVTVAAALIWVLVEPFYKIIVFAGILALLLDPARAWIEEKLGGRQNITAVIIILTAGLLIIVPVFFLLWVFLLQAADLVGQVTKFLESGQFEDWVVKIKAGFLGHWIENRLDFLPAGWVNIEEQLPKHLRGFGEKLLTYGSGFAGDVFVFISHFFMMMFMLFFLVRDGRGMLRGLRSLLPTSRAEEDNILRHVSDAARAVVMGNLLTAICQGIVGGIGLAIVGLPGLVLGAVMGLASMIPVLGTGLVSIPSVLWLLATKQWISALVLTAWVLFLVSPIDNYLRPYFMRGAAGESTFFVFIAIIGGIAHFGVSGIILGPMILALAVALLQIYRYEFVVGSNKAQAS